VVRRTARIAPAVLPVRFGTLVASERSLVALLDEWSDELLAALALVDGRCQMTLRLFAPAGFVPLPKQNGAADPATVAGNLSGTSYLEGRARAQARAQSAPELEPLREALASIVAAERITRHDQGPLLLTAYHLIPRGAAPAYRKLLQRHAALLHARATVSGPWPPYAFVPELRR
jgi:Gas vesicle synthesis protein GvpL/GvpF